MRDGEGELGKKMEEKGWYICRRWMGRCQKFEINKCVFCY